MPKGRLSATNLALYHHLNCDLYLHNVYHRPADETDAQDGVPPSSRTQAHIERGLRWEQTLFTWLADQLLLLELPEDALPPEQIVDMIRNDARDHFFVVGLTLHPPQDFFNRLYDQGGLDRVMFSVAKPDLLEIFRPSRDTIIWRIIDAKSSDNVKAGSAAIWLSSSTGQPSFGDLRPVALSLLAPSLHSFLFGRLPRLLVQPKDEVEWHYNPLCRNCPYESECRGTSLMEGTLGTVPNISHTEAHAVRTLLNLSRGPTPDAGISDIEELHGLFADASRWKTLESTYPATFNKARKILGVSRRRNAQGVFMSPPALDAAISGEIKVTQKRSYTCPQSEDIAVVLSLVKDPSVYSLPFSYFCLSVFTSLDGLQTQKPVTGLPPHLVSALASIIRDILQIKPTPTTQFYVFSSAEHSALQSHLVDSALNLTDSDEDLRLCIGALASGASLLRTTYQPIILSGALLPFSFGPGNHSSLEICAERLGIKSDASTNLSSAIRAKLRDVFLEFEIRNSMAEDESRRTLLGQLPRVVSIKSEVNRLLALPVPGYWDFEECANTLVTEDLGRECPKDDDILASLTSAAIGDVQSKLKWRNVAYAPGRLTANCMDICEEEHLRKLFFMQQFEVLSRLTDLWKARIEGCPDAPIIEYQSATVGSRIERHFKVVSGAIDMLIDKEKNFYEYLLVAEGDDTEEIPVEALFDDLSVANLHFPLGVNSTDSWENQHPVVQDNLALADLLGVSSGRRKQATLTLQIWTGGAFRLAVGRRYRLSPRLVDFNTSKVLTTLFELDILVHCVT
ncbi:hypothetical protein ONZ45_g17464 [Pleurotus djamor]|nr:hypothetical protein ONZ45_g17464 [Pleurotus djamor]